MAVAGVEGVGDGCLGFGGGAGRGVSWWGLVGVGGGVGGCLHLPDLGGLGVSVCAFRVAN